MIILKKLPIRIRHFFLDSLRDAKMWYYAIIGKLVPVPLRDDYDVTDNIRWLIEFSAIDKIKNRREKLLKAGKGFIKSFIKYIIAPSIVYWLAKLLP